MYCVAPPQPLPLREGVQLQEATRPEVSRLTRAAIKLGFAPPLGLPSVEPDAPGSKPKRVHPFQGRTVLTLHRGNDCVCIAPTGAGKSLIIALDILMLQEDDKAAQIYVCEPLRSIMRSLCAEMNDYGIKAIWYDGEQPNLEDHVVSTGCLPLDTHACSHSCMHATH